MHCRGEDWVAGLLAWVKADVFEDENLAGLQRLRCRLRLRADHFINLLHGPV